MESSRTPASRIDEHGRRQVAPTWESLGGRQIREAIEDGILARASAGRSPSSFARSDGACRR